MLIMLVFGIILWVIYGILISNIPLIGANTISLILNITLLSLKIKYG